MRSFLLVAVMALATSAFAEAPYHQKVDKELNEWNAKVESLRDRSQQAGEKTRETIQKDTAELQQKLAEARETLNKMLATSADKSKPLRQNLNQALHEIRNLYRKAVSHIKASDSKEDKPS